MRALQEFVVEMTHDEWQIFIAQVQMQGIEQLSFEAGVSLVIMVPELIEKHKRGMQREDGK